MTRTEFLTANTNAHATRLTRWLLACGVVGPLLFIVVFLIEGATRAGYSVWNDYVSELALGDQGWEQIANFIQCGLLIMAFALGLKRLWPTGKASVWGPLLIGGFGLSLVVAGVFVTDPHGAPQTWHGTVHGVNALPAFFLPTAACFVLARRFASTPEDQGWACCSVITGVLVLSLFVISLASGVISEHGGTMSLPTGLFQRASIILGWGWLAMVALYLMRKEIQETMAVSRG